jgi:filamentous hemagglutinin family protein
MSGMYSIWRYLLGIAVGSAWVWTANCALAQIAADRTLPNNSNITINGSVFNITGGTQAGRNLFHSFQTFSVPTGGTASFNNGLDIQNIFSRVTGGSASSIDGIIKANGTANLFFLNPNGIVFGKNASLNVGGSFVATTANAILFGNLGTFSASVPNNPALLTINPTALFYNQIAAGASIQNSSTAPAGVAPTGGNSSGLRVLDGKSLLLVGGEVTVDGGRLRAYGGRVELGGLASPGTVGLAVDGNNLSLSFPTESNRASVSLLNGANIDVSSGGGGSITINANNLNIAGGSGLIAGIAKRMGNFGAKAGDITLNATGDVKIDGSNVFNFVEAQAIGSGGNINLSSNSLVLSNNGQLDAGTLGQGDSGKVSIQAKGSVSLTNGVIFNTVEPGAVGNSGGITVDVGRLLMTDGGELQASTLGKGNAGNVTVQARENVSIDGVGSDGYSSYSSGIFSTVKPTGEGRAGNITITARSLSLTKGSFVLSNTRGFGDAGNIRIQASDGVFVDGTFVDETRGIHQNTEIATTVAAGVGNGGNIRITTGLLSLTNGGEVNATTYAKGNAGKIVVDASRAIIIDGPGKTGFSSGISNEVGGSTAVGKGGDITLTTEKLEITNGAFLATDSSGQGDAGNIGVNTRSILLNNQAVISTGTLSGNGGNIKLQVRDFLLLRHNSQISSSAGTAQAGGNGGNITINAPNGFVVGVPNENSDITANAFFGSGGVVNINALGIYNFNQRSLQDLENLLGTKDPTQLDSQKLPTNDITAISLTSPTLSGQVNIVTPDIDPSKGLQELPIDIFDVSRLINHNLCVASQGSEFIVTGRGGLPPSPYDILSADTTWEDWWISPQPQTKLTPTTHNSSHKQQTESTTMIAAQGWVMDANGNVILTAKPVTATPQGSWLHPQNCQMLRG